MSVIQSLFIDRMEHRWSGFGNVVTPQLRIAWYQLCTAFNDKLRASEDAWEEEVWKVLCPPTGSGKTQGLIVYASILNASPQIHPGLLVVTRLMDDADSIACQINELSRQYACDPAFPDTAISYHSGKKGSVKMQELAEYPVLVVTHNAYATVLDVLNWSSSIEGKWDHFNNFKAGRRKLTVIDEAINLIEYSEVKLQDVKNLLHFGEALRDNFPAEWEAVTRLKDLLAKLEDKKNEVDKELILNDKLTADWFFTIELTTGATVTLDNLDFPKFKEALGKVRMDQVINKSDSSENMRLIANCHQTLSAVNSLFHTFIYYSRNQSNPTFNAARYIVPPEARGGVILDATATCNTIYELLPNASVILPPAGTRNYSNVSLRVSYGHKVGKADTEGETKALSIAQDLVRHLDARFSRDFIKRKVLIVTHKAVEPYLLQCIPENFTISVAHWGALDGSNDWNDCDTVVVFGLPYKPRRWSAAVFMGYQGMQSTLWLRDKSQRMFKEYEDIRQAIDNGQMTADIIQAVNRIHCRRVIDISGNCPPTDIFMLLPTANEAAALLKGIVNEMPRVVVKEWDYMHQKQEKRGRKFTGRGNWDESLVAYLKNLNIGDRVAASTIKSTLSIKDDAWKAIIQRIKDVGSIISSELQNVGVVYQMEKQRASFTRV